MIRVPDVASFAAIHMLETVLGRRFGGSTGTNMVATLQLAERMVRDGMEGSIVTLACDPGDRYADTYFNAQWLNDNGHDIAPWRDRLLAFAETGAGSVTDAP